jgi:hypothetical protein
VFFPYRFCCGSGSSGFYLRRPTQSLSVRGRNRQCLDRRIGEKEELLSEVAEWEHRRDTAQYRVDWQFTTADARVKLKGLYPSIQTG